MATTPVKICVVGPWGRMGSRVVEEARERDDVAVHSVLLRTVIEDDPRVRALPEGCLVSAEADDALRGVDVVIDFTAPAICGWLAPKCAEEGVAYVVASTGLSDANHQVIDAAAESVAVLQAANLSVGVNALLEMAEWAAEHLTGFDPEIFEVHHRYKRDAPSGTAYALGEAVQVGRPGLSEVPARAGEQPRGENELGYATLRGGDVPGEHTVFFFGEGERVELTHRSSTSNIFASGAIRAALWLAEQAPGRYTMRHVIS